MWEDNRLKGFSCSDTSKAVHGVTLDAVRICLQYAAQGHVKIKIPSSLLWIIF